MEIVVRGPALLLLLIALLLAAGRHLSRCPPAWLKLDPIEHPFGLDLAVTASDHEMLEEDGPPLVSAEHPLDINHASVRELTALPKVGPVLAQRIVALRDSLGRFQELEQLRAVKGVGARTLEGLRPLVRLGEGL